MRVKFMFEGEKSVNEFDVMIEDFPGTPRDKELLDLEDICEERGLTEDQLTYIYGYSWSVEYVVWSKDEKGIYLRVATLGE